jgi:hypothetical protein
MLHQTEVSDLDPIGQQEKVAGFDVEVLEIVLVDQMIQTIGGVAQIAQEFIARDSRTAALPIFVGEIVEALVGQFHHDHEFARNDLDSIHGDNKRMANFLNAFQSFEFLLGLDGVAVEGVEIAVDELDRFVDPAWSNTFPHFAEATRSEGFDQAVSW